MPSGRVGEESSSDVMLARMTADVPGGFAGTLVEHGRTIVLLADPAQRDAARTALNGLSMTGPRDFTHAEFRKATWTLGELVAWYRFIVANARSTAVRSSYINQPGNRIVLTVANGTDRQSVIRRLESLNLPCDLVNVEILGAPRLSSAP
jgi:hypothetical protein